MALHDHSLSPPPPKKKKIMPESRAEATASPTAYFYQLLVARRAVAATRSLVRNCTADADAESIMHASLSCQAGIYPIVEEPDRQCNTEAAACTGEEIGNLWRVCFVPHSSHIIIPSSACRAVQVHMPCAQPLWHISYKSKQSLHIKQRNGHTTKQKETGTIGRAQEGYILFSSFVVFVAAFYFLIVVGEARRPDEAEKDTVLPADISIRFSADNKTISCECRQFQD